MPRTPGGLFTLAEQRPVSRRRRRVFRWLTAVLVTLLAVAGYLAWGQLQVITPGCTARVGASQVELTPEQAANAAVISAVAGRRGLPTRAATIAIATALQESKLRNLRYGDRDSLGLFQQRPSQGWGTPEQILDPVYASTAFYERLVTVRDYLTRPLTDVAQAVQRSGAPQAYAQHEDEATVLAAALTGATPAALSCLLRRPDAPGEPARLSAALGAHHGLSAVPSGAGLTVSIPAESPASRAWAVAAWAIAHAEAFGVERVTVAPAVWSRAQASWTGPVGGRTPTEVVLSLAR